MTAILITLGFIVLYLWLNRHKCDPGVPYAWRGRMVRTCYLCSKTVAVKGDWRHNLPGDSEAI